MNTYHFHTVVVNGSFAHATNSGIYTRAISPDVKIPILIVAFFSLKLGDYMKAVNF